MSVRNQLQTLKDNWLLLSVGIIVVLMLWGRSTFSGIQSESQVLTDSIRVSPGSSGDSGFAPGESDRIRQVTTYTTISTDAFSRDYDAVLGWLRGADSIILRESQNEQDIYETKRETAFVVAQVPVTEYESFKAFLEQYDLETFNKQSEDVTAEALSLEEELGLEEERLSRLEELYDETSRLQEKWEVEDRIYDTQRRIRILENQIESVQENVEYVSVRISLEEDIGPIERVNFDSFSELIAKLLNSTSTLLSFVFYIAPWALLGGTMYYTYKNLRR